MSGIQQLLEVFHRAEDGVDVAEIRNVVAEVGHRAGENRRHPESIDERFFQVIQLAHDTCNQSNVSRSKTYRFSDIYGDSWELFTDCRWFAIPSGVAIPTGSREYLGNEQFNDNTRAVGD